jgi:hypothetical protein
MKKLIVTGFLLASATLVMAKLPPPGEEAKAKSAETAAKAAWSGKVDAYLSCKSQDRVVAHYYKTAKSNNKEVKAAAPMPPCADPGAFTYVPVVATKPIEAAGAHSPAGTATSPPSSVTPAAAIAPAKKS